jgi:DNA invertase Pin-like site-specific DNA recombinase/Tfp pilus assembly protein PilV
VVTTHIEKGKAAMKAIGYIRVSRVAGRSGATFISPEEQRKSIEALAAREGFEVIEYLEEFDKSGGDNKRPIWNECIERIETGEVQGIAVWNLARFSRSLIDALKAIERIEAAGGVLRSAAGETGDDSPSGKFARNMFLAMAQFEREQKRESFEVAQIAAIERGIFIAPLIPTGYYVDLGPDPDSPRPRRLLPDPTWAPVVKGLFQRRADSWSWSQLTGWFIEQGGNPETSRQTIMNMLRNTTYLGWSRHGQKLNKNAHEPLVSQKLFDEASAKKPHFENNGRLSSQVLLNGIVRCDACGRPMTVTTAKRGGASYACKTYHCNARAAVTAAHLDAEVLARILSAHQWMPRELATRSDDNSIEIADAREGLEAAEYDRSRAISNEGMRREMSDAEYNAELHRLTVIRDTARAAFDLVEAANDAPAARRVPLSETWDSWSDDERRTWLRKAVRELVVKSANRKPVPVAERMALSLSGRLDSKRWLLAGGRYAAAPFGEERLSSKFCRPFGRDADRAPEILQMEADASGQAAA